MFNLHRQWQIAFATVIALAAVPQITSAAGTLAGTDVTNTATLSYEVGGVPQTDIDSNTTTFEVDSKIDLTVATIDAAAVPIGPGATAPLTFTVTNTGNAIQDYALSVTQPDGGAGAFGGTDAFDTTTLLYYEDDGDGVFDAGDVLLPLSAGVPYIDELAADATVRVFVVSTAPNTQPNGDIARLDLLATTHDAYATTDYTGALQTGALGIATVNNTAAWDPDVIQSVFADGAGTLDPVEDGQHSSASDYIVSSSVIGVTKSVATVWDPVNLTTDPKAFPGAVVAYTIAIANTGTASATLSTVVDTIDASLSLVAPAGFAAMNSNATWTCTGTTRAGDSAANPLVNETNGTDGNGDGLVSSDPGVGATPSVVTATLSTILILEGTYTAGELKPGETCSVTFQAAIE